MECAVSVRLERAVIDRYPADDDVGKHWNYFCYCYWRKGPIIHYQKLTGREKGLARLVAAAAERVEKRDSSSSSRTRRHVAASQLEGRRVSILTPLTEKRRRCRRSDMYTDRTGQDRTVLSSNPSSSLPLCLSLHWKTTFQTEQNYKERREKKTAVCLAWWDERERVYCRSVLVIYKDF